MVSVSFVNNERFANNHKRYSSMSKVNIYVLSSSQLLNVFLCVRYLVVPKLTQLKVNNILKIGPNLCGLYLNGLSLKKIPSFVFTHLPNLQWLDLRDNIVMDIPKEIVQHNKLRVDFMYTKCFIFKYFPFSQVLLLQNNLLPRLAPHLSLVRKLEEVKFSGNSLEFPPEEILIQHWKQIKLYLKQFVNSSKESLQISILS